MVELDRAFWQQRWETAHRASAGGPAEPNRTLTRTAEQLAGGAALDAGCGEGVDALWLASRGWRVTAVDFVDTALERGRARSAEIGVDIDWLQADLSVWTPPACRFDLVSAHYLHGIAQRDELFRRLAAAVRPGGTLLIVGHHPSNADISGGTVPDSVFFTADDVVAVLDDEWEVLTADDDVPRKMTSHEGRPLELRSAVVRARRR
jgi:SAM-dependent methyltransferase